MEFFNKKEDVIDIKLTRYGKNLLSRGSFKPVYYMFFDDDILYNSKKGGFTEEQNKAEERILKNTPRLKTQSVTLGVETNFDVEYQEYAYSRDKDVALDDILSQQYNSANGTGLNQLEEGLETLRSSLENESGTPVDPMGSFARMSQLDLDMFATQNEKVRSKRKAIEDNNKLRFYPFKKVCDYITQERILLYPIHKQEIQSQESPYYDVLSLGTNFQKEIEYQHFTASGIIKNVPQLTMSPSYTVIKDITNKTEPRQVTREDSFDLTSEEVVFADQSKLSLEKKEIILDIEEVNTFSGNDNFTLEVYEVETTKDENDKDINILKKIDDISDIRSLFSIKADESIKIDGEAYKNKRQKNNKKRFDL
jgi:hypothetical protein